MIAGCSSGIEPVFALAFEHRVKGPGGERVLPFVSETFERLARARGFHSDSLMAEVARRGSVQGVAAVDASAQALFKVAHEIDASWHVRHQAAFQRHTDNGVSKTVNVPHDTTPEEVAHAYLLAWREGCLGITVFRDGCKADQVLTSGVRGEPEAALEAGLLPERVVKPRPHSLTGATYRMETPIGTAFITVNDTPAGDPFEVFVQVGKAGSDTRAVAEALGSGLNLAMRDLEIRGAGNMLGGEQSGFIMEMGFEMYTKILEDAVSRTEGAGVRRGVRCCGSGAARACGTATGASARAGA